MSQHPWTRIRVIFAIAITGLIGVAVWAKDSDGQTVGAGQKSGYKRLVILHTNDIQSRLLGFGPNAEYSPLTLGDDGTVGGFARLVTLIKERRAEHEQAGRPVLLLDGGDMTMGTLFHTVTRETGGELRLMKLAGYDGATIGNHEFDFRPKGLAQMIRSALKKEGKLPELLMSNLDFDPNNKADDDLELLMKEGHIKRYVVLERGGLRIGLFGLLGYDGWEVTKTAGPLRFLDPTETAGSMASLLRDNEKVDLVVLLSHSGVSKNEDGSWGGEEVELARKVEGIDVIVGGHSHTPIHKPALINGKTPVL